MRREIEEELKGHIIPFWEGLKDPDNGGFYGYLSYDLILDKNAGKGVILNSRILWFFSEAARVLKDPSLLPYADCAYRFLVDHCVDTENGGVYWSVSATGEPVDTTKHTYNQAFAIYALSAYYRATGNADAKALAASLFHLIESRMKDEGGYLEAFDDTFHPVSNEKLSENGVLAGRTMNTILHVIEAYTGYVEATDDKDARAALREALMITRDKIYLPDKKRLGVFFDADYHSLIDLYSYGHDIEAAWLIDRALDAVGDPDLTKEMHQITDTLVDEVYREGFDGKSIPVECEKGVVKGDRVWWVQAEAINGFLENVDRHPEHTDYVKAAEAEWEYIKRYIIDKRKGSEWFWYANPDGTPSHDPIVEPWKCPYHNGRMCLNVIEREV